MTKIKKVAVLVELESGVIKEVIYPQDKLMKLLDQMRTNGKIITSSYIINTVEFKETINKPDKKCK